MLLSTTALVCTDLASAIGHHPDLVNFGNAGDTVLQLAGRVSSDCCEAGQFSFKTDVVMSAHLDLLPHALGLLLHLRQLLVPEHLLCSIQGIQQPPVQFIQYLQTLLDVGIRLHCSRQLLTLPQAPVHALPGGTRA